MHDIVTVDGRRGLVVDRLPGTSILEQVGRNPLLLERVARALAQAHVALHQVAAPVGLPDLRVTLMERIDGSEPLRSDLRPQVLAVLASLPDGDRLCHGDLHPGNMLGSADAPVVIDWGGASRGDPLGDMVRTAVLIRVGRPPPGSPRILRLLAPFSRSFMSARYVAHYRELSGVDMTDFTRWRVVRCAARLGPNPDKNPPMLRILRRDLAALRGADRERRTSTSVVGWMAGADRALLMVGRGRCGGLEGRADCEVSSVTTVLSERGTVRRSRPTLPRLPPSG